MACVKLEVNCVKVICDETDVLALLTVYVFQQSRKLKKLMEAFGTSRSLIDINETAKKHAEILPSLMDACALSGCDSVPKLNGTGKKTVINRVKDQNLSLSILHVHKLDCLIVHVGIEPSWHRILACWHRIFNLLHVLVTLAMICHEMSLV